MADTTTLKCASCKHIGVAYWFGGSSPEHHCRKSSERRSEGMPKGADLFDHFRTFFDASAEQRACRRYEERPISDESVLSILRSMESNGGRADLKFLSEENRIAEMHDGKFWKSDWNAATKERCHRVFRILPVGKSELARASNQRSPESGALCT